MNLVDNNNKKGEKNKNCIHKRSLDSIGTFYKLRYGKGKEENERGRPCHGKVEND